MRPVIVRFICVAGFAEDIKKMSTIISHKKKPKQKNNITCIGVLSKVTEIQSALRKSESSM